MANNNVGTRTLTSESVTLTSDMGIRSVAMKLVSGTVTYEGTLPLGTLASTAIALASNDPVCITFDGSIVGLVINATLGSVQLIYGR